MDAIVPVADVTLLGLFMQANWIVKLVMIGLLIASLWSWAVIFDKLIAFANTRRSIKRFEQVFWSGQSLEDLYRNLDERRVNGMASVFMAAMREWKKSLEKGARSPFGLQMRIDKAMDVALARETDKLEARLGFLATIGSASPFIGLFGTVIGIMTSFQAIAQSQNTSLAIVAPGIAEALLATAIGLLAAIPAVIAYNKLSADAGRIGAQLEGFADEFSGILSRQIDERANAQRPSTPAPQYTQQQQQHTQQHAQQPHAPQQHAQPQYMPRIHTERQFPEQILTSNDSAEIPPQDRESFDRRNKDGGMF